MGCCTRYGIDVTGIIFAVFLVGMATTNQIILYTSNVAWVEITFLAGGGMCIISLLIFMWRIIQMVRAKRRYNNDYADWDTDMESYASPFDDPQQVVKTPRNT